MEQKFSFYLSVVLENRKVTDWPGMVARSPSYSGGSRNSSSLVPGDCATALDQC